MSAKKSFLPAGDPRVIALSYRYRRAILTGAVRVPPAAARLLLGPDLAYHLYRSIQTQGKQS